MFKLKVKPILSILLILLEQHYGEIWNRVTADIEQIGLHLFIEFYIEGRQRYYKKHFQKKTEDHRTQGRFNFLLPDGDPKVSRGPRAALNVQ